MPTYTSQRVLRAGTIRRCTVFLYGVRRNLLSFQYKGQVPYGMTQLTTRGFSRVFSLLFRFAMSLIMEGLVRVFRFTTNQEGGGTIFVRRYESILQITNKRPKRGVRILAGQGVQVLFRLIRHVTNLYDVIYRRTRVNRGPTTNYTRTTINSTINRNVVNTSCGRFRLFLLSCFESQCIVDSALLQEVRFFAGSRIGAS